MLPGSGLAVLFLLATSSARSLAQSCLCSGLLPAGLHVNCSSLARMEKPHLPSDTVELHIQDSQLTTVPPGLFDRLTSLRKVFFSGNRFHCDCKIQYLRNWLLRNRALVSGEPTCASPSSVALTAITELSDDFFSSCAQPGCGGWIYNTVIGVMLCGLIILLMWGLTLARKTTFTLDIDKRHTGFQASSLRSLKPKHRKRLQSTTSEVSGNSDSLSWTEDLERPLLNMELLPQILDVLHKKHNIKIKAT